MSRLPFELLIALRYLRPKRTFVSVITTISVFGVMLGVAVLIIVIGVMSGFDKELRERILGFNAHMKIYRINPATGQPVRMENFRDVMRTVNSNQLVEGSTPMAFMQVMLQTEPPKGDSLFRAPYLRGVDPATASVVSIITSNIVFGTNEIAGDGLLIGISLASELDLHVHDRVALHSPRDLEDMWKKRDATNAAQDIIPPRDFEITGIFDANYYEYNYTFVVSSLANYQDLNRYDDAAQGVMVMLKDPYQANRVREQLFQALGEKNYKISTWPEEGGTMEAVMVEKNVMLYILFFIVIVAAFGITCTLITFVVLKTREIGVMKALGASSEQILWVFMCQSMVVSIIGVLTGTVAGLLLLTYRNPFLHLMRRMTHIELFPSSIYGFSQLPALIIPRDILIICGGSFIICLLAAIFPAWHASRLKPVEALRRE